VVRARQVGHDRRFRIRLVYMKNVDPIDMRTGLAPSSEPARVGVRPDLKHVPLYVTDHIVAPTGVAPEEVVDVIPIDWRSAVQAEVSTDRRKTAQASEPDETPRRPSARRQAE
jgi:hypothetical protein